MKLSTIIAQTILLTGIVASPVAAPEELIDPPNVEEALKNFYGEVQSKIEETTNQLEKRDGRDHFCYGDKKHPQCHLGAYSKCVPYITPSLIAGCFVGGQQVDLMCTRDGQSQAEKHCQFYCSKIETKKDCEEAAKSVAWKYNCGAQKYCK